MSKEVTKYKAIIFDLDGTLLDTVEDLKEAVNYVMRKYSEPEITLADARHYVGNGNRRLIALAQKEGEMHPHFEQMFEEFLEYYLAHDTIKTVVYDGIRTVIATCQEKGIKMAVVSNKFQSATKELMDFYFPDTFDSVIGERNGLPRKPDPTLAKIALEDLGVTAKETLFIGDSEVDADTAENAGMEYLLCSWGFKERSFLEKRNAVSVIDRPIQILDFI